MIEWVDENVAIGDWKDARDLDLLRSDGIDLIIDARLLFDDSQGRKRRTPRSDLIEREIGFMLALVGMGARILIRCYHGRDRSPFVAMAYMSRRRGIPYKDTYHVIKEKRPITVFHWDWVKQLESQFPGPVLELSQDDERPD